MPGDLGSIVASAREDVQLLKRMGNAQQAAYIEQLLDQIRDAAEDFLTWLSEDKAYLKSGLSHRTLRRRFRELMDCGMARYSERGEREFRSCAIPPRADATAAKAAGLAGESLRRTA